jgi:hypothetical protein
VARQYQFVTNWRVDAPIEEVWVAIADSLRWPEWWPGVTKVVDIAPGRADGINLVRRYTFRSVLPYDLVFDVRATRVQAPTALDGEASGELIGTGRWLLRSRDEATLVRYIWEVDTGKRWMNALAPLLRPLFVWNHHAIMRAGEAGLRRHLEGARAASH